MESLLTWPRGINAAFIAVARLVRGISRTLANRVPKSPRMPLIPEKFERKAGPPDDRDQVIIFDNATPNFDPRIIRAGAKITRKPSWKSCERSAEAPRPKRIEVRKARLLAVAPIVSQATGAPSSRNPILTST
jgi:hypothetical protein